MNLKKLLKPLLRDYKKNPIDLLGLTNGAKEYNYLASHKNLYLKTLIDVKKLFPGNKNKKISVLEIGCFLGIISLALAKLKFQVTATDLKEYLNCRNLQKKFHQHHILFRSCNLKHGKLPFNKNQFNLVIATEVFEHFNFNPIPIVKEIWRILKPKGFLYLTVPNIARFSNRIKLAKGQTILNPIKDFYQQLDPRSNFCVGLHWREYSIQDLTDLFNKKSMFKIKEISYFNYDKTDPKMNFFYLLKKNIFEKLTNLFGLESFKSNLLLICQKI